MKAIKRYTAIKFPLLLACALLVLTWTACNDDDEAQIKVNRMVITNIPEEGLTLIEGDTWNANVSTLPENAVDATDYTYRYTSGNEAVFTVDDAGTVTATGVGEAVLTAWSVNNTDLWTTCLVKVEKRIYPVTSIEIPEKFRDHHIGVERTFDLGSLITVLPANATTPDVVYQSSDAMIAEVNEYGEVYTKALGDVTITVKAVDGSNVTASCKIHVQNVEYTDLLDRIGWTVSTSHPYIPDAVVNGAPECLIDDDLKTCLALVKPGKTVGDVQVGKDESVFFVLDMQTPQTFDFFKLRHRTNNTSANLRVTKVSAYGSNDGETFTELLKQASVPTAASISEVIIDLPSQVTYRYFKLTYDGWSNSGNTIQMSDFNLGNIKYLENEPDNK